MQILTQTFNCFSVFTFLICGKSHLSLLFDRPRNSYSYGNSALNLVHPVSSLRANVARIFLGRVHYKFVNNVFNLLTNNLNKTDSNPIRKSKFCQFRNFMIRIREFSRNYQLPFSLFPLNNSLEKKSNKTENLNVVSSLTVEVSEILCI